MLKSLSVVVLLSVLVLFAAPARAATVYSGTNFRIDASTPVPVGNSLQAVTLTAVALGAFNPNAFDGMSSGKTGITGSIYQVFVGSAPGSTITPATNVQQTPLLDSHFLVDTNNIIPAPGGSPTENRVTLNNSEDPNGGFGNLLTGAFTLAGSPVSTWDFAYLTALAGTTITLNFSLGGSNGATGTSELVNTSFTIVPEPSSLVLLAAAAMGLVSVQARRRRVALR